MRLLHSNWNIDPGLANVSKWNCWGTLKIYKFKVAILPIAYLRELWLIGWSVGGGYGRWSKLIRFSDLTSITVKRELGQWWSKRNTSRSRGGDWIKKIEGAGRSVSVWVQRWRFFRRWRNSGTSSRRQQHCLHFLEELLSRSIRYLRIQHHFFKHHFFSQF